jgi:hypothetical protein
MLIHINAYVFYEICSKNIDTYYEYMHIVNEEYVEIINELRNTTQCDIVRFNIHKLVGILSNLGNVNYEINYICKTILNFSKQNTDMQIYVFYLNMLLDFDKTKLGL